MNVSEASTRQLLDELDRRMADWPGGLGTARAVMRGCMDALKTVAETEPVYAQALEQRRLKQ